MSSFSGGRKAAIFFAVILTSCASAQTVPLDSVISVPVRIDSSFPLSFYNALSQVRQSEMIKTIEVLTSDSLDGRATGTKGYRRAAEYVASRLRDYGCDSLSGKFLQEFNVASADLSSHIFFESNGKDSVTTENVIAIRRGKFDSKIDPLVVVMAHLDHLGRQGSSIYRGANDNASGISVMLEVARLLKEHRPTYSVIFVAFSGEEAGLLGSRYMIEHLPFDPKRVSLMINLDLVGSGRQGIMVQGVQDFPKEHGRIRELNDRFFDFELGSRPNSPNSDQYFFNRAGLPAFFLYAYNGTAPYHSPDDIPERLDGKVLENVARFVFACVWAFSSAP